MTKQQQKQIDKLYEEEQKKFVEWKRKENPKREKERRNTLLCGNDTYNDLAYRI